MHRYKMQVVHILPFHTIENIVAIGSVYIKYFPQSDCFKQILHFF